jgi:hypothetical protein
MCIDIEILLIMDSTIMAIPNIFDHRSFHDRAGLKVDMPTPVLVKAAKFPRLRRPLNMCRVQNSPTSVACSRQETK